jgi:hypothetical protein
MWGATGAGRDKRRAVTGAAGNTMDARGFDGLGEGHGRQDRGEPPRQHRLARPRRPQEQDVVVTTPASHFASPVPLEMPMDPLLNLPVKLASLCGTIS